MDIKDLVNITARAWAFEILAHLHAGVAGRQAALVAATGAGRTAFRESLAHLTTLGLIERNPGHGHPLRPEFRLTESGTRAAALAGRVLQAAREREAGPLLRKRWSLPVLTIAHAPRRFTEVKASLVPITDRALSQSFVQLEKRGWVSRVIDPTARPSYALYRTDGPGREVSSIVCAQLLCSSRP
ncbi:MAG: winged helix-turn-helix transcriptional regulator [Pseudomonadota bacterium]